MGGFKRPDPIGGDFGKWKQKAAKEPKARKPPTGYPHISKRTGEHYPRTPNSGQARNWTGWLTHREYDIIETYLRYGIDNIFYYQKRWGLQPTTCANIYNMLKSRGILEGEMKLFTVKPAAVILFRKTEQYMIDYQG